MSLQWYPGHMTKARRELAALLPSQDVVLEILDARLPVASSNPMLAQLRRDKPCVKVLTRSDLADPAMTRAWVEHFAREPGVAAFASTTDRPAETRKRIAELCADKARHRGPDKAVRALIAGVPNVGKSTLINILMNKEVAKVGDKPAITKRQQRVVLASGMVVTDTPGLMWPRIEDEAAALRMALVGSIPDTAIDYMIVALFGARVLMERHPALLLARFKLTAMPATPEALIDEIGRRRGALVRGGEVDVNRAAQILVREVRSGSLGRICLESPEPQPR